MSALTLGVHVGHDAAAAVLASGRLVHAEEEERHTRRKAQGGCPWNAIDAGLAAAGAGDDDVGTVALTWRLDRYLACRRDLAEHARSVGNEAWYEKRQREISVMRAAVDALRARFPNATIVDVPHHRAHLACAVYFAPRTGDGPVVGLVVDALGDAESLTAFGASSAAELLSPPSGAPSILLTRSARQSIGFFYKRAAEAFGFEGSEACGYLMSLSGCGDGADLAEGLRPRLFGRDADGLSSFEPSAFDPFRGHSATALRCFSEAIAGADGDLLDRAAHANAVQAITEAYLHELVGHLVTTHRPRTLFFSGGVSLNCVALAKLARAFPSVAFRACPVKKDSGTAVGAAVLVEARRAGLDALERPASLRLGAAITGEEDVWTSGRGVHERSLALAGAAARYERFPTRSLLVASLVRDIEAGEIVALVDGRGELGPRALGARSILAAAGSAELRAHLNARVKDRYAFQPFAGAFLEETFERAAPGELADEHMSYAARIDPGAVPALAGILHRDGTTRVQLVGARGAPEESTVLRAALLELAARHPSGPAVVLNTSFNARGEPMPRTAAEAIDVACRLGIDRVYTPVGCWYAGRFKVEPR